MMGAEGRVQPRRVERSCPRNTRQRGAGGGLGLRGGAGPALSQVLVDIGGEEPWVGVPVHQRVDLQLGVFERVRRGVLHLPVYHLPNPGIQTDLFWR